MNRIVRLKTYNQRLYRFLENIPIGAEVLDVGVGQSSLFRERKTDKRLFITGIDILEKNNVDNCVDDYHKIDLNTTELFIHNKMFDAVCCNHVIEHLHSHNLVRNILKYFVKANGTVYIAGPNERSLFVPSFGFYHEQKSPFNFYDDMTHVRPVTNQSLFDLMNECGYYNIDVGVRKDRLGFFVIIPKIIMALIKKDRNKLVHTVWDLIGWESQVVARKK